MRRTAYAWPPALLAALLAATTGRTAPLPDRLAHPLVDLQTGYLLGGSAGGRWLNAQAIARSLKGGQSYRAYDSRRLLGAAQGSKPRSQGAPCDETLFVKMAPARGEFALGGSWNALPRSPRAMSLDQPVYRGVVAAFLKQHGLARPVVRLAQVWRVDLDGDGEPEVLVSAANTQGRPVSPNHLSSSVSAGDYSVVLLRKAVRGQLKTIVLEAEVHPKSVEFSAPNVSRIAGVLDADGDGKMEILVRSRYYEGTSTTVYQLQGGQAPPVLSEGCGA